VGAIVSSFMHVHLIALRYFRETVRCGSMRQAAEALRVAPSAINRQILKLEDQLQCKLFERMADGVRLTGAGEVLYRHAREIDALLDRALSELDDLRGLRRGRVGLASEDGIIRDVLPPLLAAFHQEFPRVSFGIDVMTGPDVVQAVAEGQCDLGLAMHPQRHPDVTVLGEAAVPIGAVMRPEHPLAQRATLRLSDLATEPVVMLKHGIGAQPDAHGLVRRWAQRTEVAETNSPGAVAALVRAGLALAMRSPIGIRAEIATGELVFVPVVDPQVKAGRLALLARRERALPVAAAVLAERVKALLAETDRETQAAMDARMRSR
jgi:DNA-binding transcriptional LysR family regulator